MFGIIKTSFGELLVSNLKCLKNQPCKARPTIVNINSDKTSFYSFTVSVNKCIRSCSTVDDLYN